MIDLDFSKCKLTLRRDGDRNLIFDPIRKKWLVLTPEEHVRQFVLQYLISVLHYPAALIAVEKTISVGAMKKRYDIVVYNRNHEPWLLAECKAPEVEITETTLHQLLNYQRTIRSDYWLLTNGHQTYCADASQSEQIEWLHLLPSYEL